MSKRHGGPAPQRGAGNPGRRIAPRRQSGAVFHFCGAACPSGSNDPDEREVGREGEKNAGLGAVKHNTAAFALANNTPLTLVSHLRHI